MMPASRIKILNIIVTLNKLLNNDGLSQQTAKLGDCWHCRSEYVYTGWRAKFNVLAQITITFFSIKHMTWMFNGYHVNKTHAPKSAPRLNQQYHAPKSAMLVARA